ncbi:MAG: FHA domain-containing protein [Polyangiaceae bacterium]
MVNRNHATMYFTVAPRPDIDETTAAAAYERARAHLATLPSEPAETEGYRLFWARSGDAGHRDIAADEHAVVGRHSACDVALSTAAELSLRHLLVVSSRSDDGAPALRVLDLHASLPFYTDDGEPRRSIVATGPVVLRLGTYLFGGIPIGPSIERPHLPEKMPRAVVRHAGPSLRGEAPAHAATPLEMSTMVAHDEILHDGEGPALAAPAVTAHGGEADPPGPPSPMLSRVTVVPKAAFLTDVAPPSAKEAFARLTLVREGHSASIDLQEADLDGGVLIGRSERCTDFGLRRVLDGNISRVHALLLRDGDDVIAFDLCSTQGIFHDGHNVRRHRISRGGGCVSLARTNPVMLCLHARAGEVVPPGAEPLP